MESRKLQKSESGSYLVTLPKSWVKERELEKGKTVSMSPQKDGSLKILPSQESVPRNKIELNINDFPDYRSLENMVKSSYMQGAEEIQVVSEKGTFTEEKEKLRNLLPELIASEITEDLPNKFTIRILADPRIFSINDLIERIYKLIISIHENTSEALIKKSPELASDASYRGIDINRLHRLAMRQLSLSIDDVRVANSIGINNHMECLLFAVSFRDIFRMGHHMKRAAGDVGSLEVDLGNGLIKAYKKMSELLLDMQRKSFKALQERDFSLSNEVAQSMSGIRKYDKEIINKIFEESFDKKTSFTLASISISWRRAAGHAVGVADVATNLVASRLKKEKS